MAPRSWNTIFSGIQAASAVAVALLAFWAFFFSSLSQKLEEHLRTEVTVAKQELVAARQAKAAVEAEKDHLSASTTKLLKIRDQLKTELSSLEHKILIANNEISTLRGDRSVYAQSTRLLAGSQYFVMIKYELATMRKIAEICAAYGGHRRWLAARRELSRLDEQWNRLPYPQKHDNNLPINKRISELDEFRHATPEMWLGMPSEPNLTPAKDRIVFTAHDVKLLNRGNHEELNAYVVA